MCSANFPPVGLPACGHRLPAHTERQVTRRIFFVLRSYESRVTRSWALSRFSSPFNLRNKCRCPILRALEHQLQQSHGNSHDLAKNSPGRSFFHVLSGLLRRPQRVLFLWNWKSAGLSILLRAPIFLAATIRGGLAATVSALLTECLFCAVTAGFYGAVVQNLRDAEPQWLTGLFLIVVVPAIFQGLEFVLHRLHGTPHLRLAEIASVAVSAVSSLFNWYAMRRGALLVGGEGRSFGSDLRRLPGLLLAFTAALPRWAGRRKKSAGSSENGVSRTRSADC